MPIPGSARLHLAAGEVDVGLRTDGAEGAPRPPPWLTGDTPKGMPEPAVIDAPRRQYQFEGHDRVRVWVVRVPQEADYDVTATGNVKANSGSRLIFGHTIWNGLLELLAGPLGMGGAVMTLGALATNVAVARALLADRRSRPYLPGSDENRSGPVSERP